MRIRLAGFGSSHLPQRLARMGFCTVWIGLALVNLWLALGVSIRGNAKLPRSGFRIPAGRTVLNGQSRFQEVINDLAERYDSTIRVAEQSLRSSARRNFWLNLSSAMLCLAGLGAQWYAGSRGSAREIRAADSRLRCALKPPQGWHGDGESVCAPRRRQSGEGSFPSGGYGH